MGGIALIHPVTAVLDEMQALIELKAADYADDGNPFSNFEQAAAFVGLTVDQVFAVMIGIKMARLGQLMSGKNPNFESENDSWMDLANYIALKLAYSKGNE